MISIKGTVCNRTIRYTHRVIQSLGLDKYTDIDFDIEFKSTLLSMAGGYCDFDEDSGIVSIEIAHNDSVGRIPFKQKLILVCIQLFIKFMIDNVLENKVANDPSQ